jgi:thiosulfate reductase cytochrome b subunit
MSSTRCFCRTAEASSCLTRRELPAAHFNDFELAMTDISAHLIANGRKTSRPIHPLILRATHWINAAAVIVMIMSGLEIHNAYPTLPFKVPQALTLGGWLGGATQWHFAAMWVLMGNGLVYLAYGLALGRFARKFLPLSPSMVLKDAIAAFTGRLSHEDLSIYNAVQKLLYSGVVLLLILVVLTGLSIWKPVQFQMLTNLFGDFDNARFIHFFAMSAIVGFLVIHVVMALLVPRSLIAMIRGR